MRENLEPNDVGKEKKGGHESANNESGRDTYEHLEFTGESLIPLFSLLELVRKSSFVLFLIDHFNRVKIVPVSSPN